MPSATAALQPDPAAAVPAVTLTSQLDDVTNQWTPLRDLLGAGRDGLFFVAEVEADGAAAIRFGDDQDGARPDPGTEFTAKDRIGNGTAGNLGAEVLAHVLTDRPEILRVRNPMPGGGRRRSGEHRGRAPARPQRLPHAGTRGRRRRLRGDGGTARRRDAGQGHVPLDRQLAHRLRHRRSQGRAVDAAFAAVVRDGLERYWMAGTDLEVEGPTYVALEIHMYVCALPDYFRSQVKAALLQRFSNRVLPDGSLGLFHPDRFTFGQTVYLSPLYAAAQDTPGVASVEVTRFGRFGVADPAPLSNGALPLGRLEVARLDNDPNFPEHGLFCLDVGGGK